MYFIEIPRSYTSKLWTVLRLSVATCATIACSISLASLAAQSEPEKCSITASADETNYSFIKNSDDEARLRSILKSKGYELSNIADRPNNFLLHIVNERRSSRNQFSVSSSVSLRRRDAGQIYVDRATRGLNCQSRSAIKSNYQGFRESPVGAIVAGTVTTLSELTTMCPGDSSPFQASVETLDSLVSRLVYKLPSCPTALTIRPNQ